MTPIGLSEAIESLRSQLTAALESGDSKRERMRFRLVEPITLELKVTLDKVGEGKLGWKIIEVGGSLASTTAHTLILKLSPEWWDGAQYSSNFLISAALPPTAPPTPSPSPADQHDGSPLSFQDGLEDN